MADILRGDKADVRSEGHCVARGTADAKELKGKLKDGGNVAAATVLGEKLAGLAISKGIKKVCFDRGGYQYHGRVKAFAEAARKAGLEF